MCAHETYLFTDSNMQKNLKYLPVPIISTEECNSTKHYNGHLNKDLICAEYPDLEETPCYVSTIILYNRHFIIFICQKCCYNRKYTL